MVLNNYGLCLILKRRFFNLFPGSYRKNQVFTGFVLNDEGFCSYSREKVKIPENKPNIFLRGNGKGRTSVVWNDSSTENTASATFTIEADNIVVFGISIRVSDLLFDE